MRSNIGSRISAGLWVVLLAISGSFAAPGFHVDAREIHLGDVIRGESSDGVFTIHNRGDAPLHLTRVKPACGCTLADYDEFIAPGESGEIRVTVHTKALNGEVARAIAVDTNDPNQARLNLSIRVVVRASVAILPAANARLSNVRRDADRVLLLVKKDPTEKGELRIHDLRASVPWITTEARRLNIIRHAADGIPTGRVGDWIVELGIGDKVEYGSRNERVHFSTGLAREPEISFPVGVVLQTPVNTSVEQVMIVPGQPVEPLLLVVRRGIDPETLQVEAEPASLGIQVTATGPRHFKVELQWDGGEAAEGSLSIRVADKQPFQLPVIRKAAD